jgi:transglutaminase-like putative cysteine protease
MHGGAPEMARQDVVLEVEHLTHYHYAAPVELAQHLAYLQPLSDERQQVAAFEMIVVPPPEHQRADLDGLGNHRLCFTVAQPHRELSVRTTARVALCTPTAVDLAATAPWETVRERLRYAAGATFEPASEFVQPSPFVPRLDALQAMADEAFVARRPIGEVAAALMANLHAGFAYRSASTVIETPLSEVLARREGVCQDFAHLMIGVLRLRGVAARYVSGYLLTTPGADQVGAPDAPWQGADASHAWVAVWCPDARGGGATWLEFDPTNNLRPALAHVRVAVGRDYGDVTPLRGVIRGGGEHRLDVRVRTQRIAG